MEERDLTKPCMLMMKELEFYKELDTSKKVSKARSKYGMMTLDELSTMNDSPVEITIKASHFSSTQNHNFLNSDW